MAALDALADELLDALLRRLRARPEVMQELRAAALPVSPTPETGPAYATVDGYAAHLRVCRRTVENLLRAGLPVSRAGRIRRIPVAEADSWLRAERSDPLIEQRARASARRHARKLAAGDSGDD